MTKVRFTVVSFLIVQGGFLVLVWPSGPPIPQLRDTIQVDQAALLLAERELMTTSRLYLSRIPQGRHTPSEVLAWRAIGASNAADSVFRLMWKGPNRCAAKLYALAGLYEYGREYYEFFKRGFRWGARSDTRVPLRCGVSDRQITEILDRIDRGEWSAVLRGERD